MYITKLEFDEYDVPVEVIKTSKANSQWLCLIFVKMGFHELHFKNTKSLIDWVENIRIIFKRSESSYCYTIFYPKLPDPLINETFCALPAFCSSFFILWWNVNYFYYEAQHGLLSPIMELLSNNCLVCYEWRFVLDFYRKYNEMIIKKGGLLWRRYYL